MKFPLLFLFFLVQTVVAQQYPQDYFDIPIKKGQQNLLSGTLGEIRSHHFHSGIDLKTDGKIGLPVNASASGYVSRIKVSPYGYGNALYIAHPNGYTTVYAHLDHFTKELDAYVLRRQYENKSFSVNLFPKSTEFPIDKGQVVAYSGNSGGSQAPHLHFEIRDANQRSVNPLLFGFSEIKDKTKPLIKKLAIVSQSISSRINGEFGRAEFQLKSLIPGKYTIEKPIEVFGKVGVEVKTYDQLDGAPNLNGPVRINLTVNNRSHFDYHIKKVDFSNSRKMDSHVNYKQMKQHKSYFNKCYVSDGNTLPYYKTINKGIISVTDTSLIPASITVTDSYGNMSILSFKLKGVVSTKKSVTEYEYSNKRTTIDYEVYQNTVKIKVANPTGFSTPATLTTDSASITLDIAYRTENELVYLWDLHKGLPKKIAFCDLEKKLDFVTLIPSLKEHTVTYPDFGITISNKALYDTLYLTQSMKDSKLTIGPRYTPIFKPIKVRITPQKNYVQRKTKAFVYYSGTPYYIGGEWKNGVVEFTTRDMGTFGLVTDTIPPIVKRVGKYKNDLHFYILDKLSGIKKFTGKLNGKWILLHYDVSDGHIWTERFNKNVPYSGQFVLEVSDNCENITKFVHNF